MIGTYLITNTINNYVYIGESMNIERRWKQHKQDLIDHIHCNYLLQKDYDVYGDSAFEYRILQEINKNDKHDSIIKIQSLLLMLEDSYIKKYKQNGYNLYNLEDTLHNLLLGDRKLPIANEFSIHNLCSYYIKYKYVFNQHDNRFDLEDRHTLMNVIKNNCSLTSYARLTEIQNYIINDLKNKGLYQSFMIDKIQCSYNHNNKRTTLIAYELNNNGLSYVMENYDFESFRKNKKSTVAKEDKNTLQKLKNILIDYNIIYGKTAYADMKKILIQEQYISVNSENGYSIPSEFAVQNGFIYVKKYSAKYNRYSFYITKKGVDYLINKYHTTKEDLIC